MTNTTIVKTLNPEIATLPVSLLCSQQQDPEQVLNFAHKAAKALMQVIDSKPKKIMIRGEKYLTFEDWQTLGRFYGITAAIEWCHSAIDEKKIFGYSARAVAYHSGNIVSAAEASCFRSEINWSDKPSFQLKSLAQTRAAAKALRNVLAWVAVLGGFRPTPAEEMIDTNSSVESSVPLANPMPIMNETDVENEIKMIEWQENTAPFMISDRQKSFLRNLIMEKVSNEDNRERQLANLDTLTKKDAHQLISELIAEPAVAR